MSNHGSSRPLSWIAPTLAEPVEKSIASPAERAEIYHRMGTPLTRRGPSKFAPNPFTPELNPELVLKGGEGSRGGKVSGHTKSGKPIYESTSRSTFAEDHKDYSAADHEDAAAKHSELSEKYADESYDKMKRPNINMPGEDTPESTAAWEKHENHSAEKRYHNLAASKKRDSAQGKLFGKSLGTPDVPLQQGQPQVPGMGMRQPAPPQQQQGAPIGMAPTGIPIYGDPFHPAHKDFGKEDHDAASAQHEKLAAGAGSPQEASQHLQAAAAHKQMGGDSQSPMERFAAKFAPQQMLGMPQQQQAQPQSPKPQGMSMQGMPQMPPPGMGMPQQQQPSALPPGPQMTKPAPPPAPPMMPGMGAMGQGQPPPGMPMAPPPRPTQPQMQSMPPQPGQQQPPGMPGGGMPQQHPGMQPQPPQHGMGGMGMPGGGMPPRPPQPQQPGMQPPQPGMPGAPPPQQASGLPGMSMPKPPMPPQQQPGQQPGMPPQPGQQPQQEKDPFAGLQALLSPDQGKPNMGNPMPQRQGPVPGMQQQLPPPGANSMQMSAGAPRPTAGPTAPPTNAGSQASYVQPTAYKALNSFMGLVAKSKK